MYILQTGLLQSTGLHEQCVNLHLLPDTTSSNIIGFIPRIRRALGTESTLKMFPLTTGPLKSALCIAAAIGDTHCCQEYISMGADLEAIGHPLGSPLAVAIYHKHFDLAKYLIRMGAKITNRGREGSYMLSPFQYAVQHPRFYRWILIERYTDQRKICPIEHNTEKLSQDFKPWSCSRKARVPLVVKRARRSDESSFDYLVRLVEMKRDFLGELVDY
ncbi:hypothetical protein BJY04DRAFT_197960 [Aspergillus karnatakaensis]|uniref:uncharacterized protein n=1 Tax=Aspergillus karnatakaensis TaxID=1810916 RepID=UPI003CCE53C9